MRAIFVSVLDGSVGDEPGIAAAADARGCPLPPADVRLILVANANCLTIEWRISVMREMEHELMAVVQEPGAVDWLVVANRQVVVQPRPAARQRLLNGDR